MQQSLTHLNGLRVLQHLREVGVDARFSPTETLGSLYSSLCGLSIMKYEFDLLFF